MPPRLSKVIQKAKQSERRLIVLPDQGAPLRLTPASLGLQSRDKSWNAYLDGFLRANGEYLDALKIELAFTAGIDTVDLSLKANGIVGAVPLRAPDTHKTIGGIIVEPRFGWGSVGSIFANLGWSSAPEILGYPLVPGSAQEVPPWIIGGPIVSYLERLLRYSLTAFREMEEVLNTPWGAIQWSTYASKQLPSGQHHLLPCKYSDLTPDVQLRRYIRWTLERVMSDLGDAVHCDGAARSLYERIIVLLGRLSSVRPLLPERSHLESMQRKMQSLSKEEQLGFTAIKWVLDERGLAGNNDLDGLSWRIVMHELFEDWVEQLVRKWAKEFGGKVTCGRKYDSQSHIRWDRNGIGSLSSLVPDVVVETADDTFIFDAKYKGFLEESHDLRWRDTQEMFREEHRHDLHQVLAYASMYQTPRVTVALVYPTSIANWNQLAASGRDVSLGTLDGPGRQIRLAIIAVPIEGGRTFSTVSNRWSFLNP